MNNTQNENWPPINYYLYVKLKSLDYAFKPTFTNLKITYILLRTIFT